MSKKRDRILSGVLTGAMLLSLISTSAFAVAPTPQAVQLRVSDIDSIQAYTDETVYGTALVEVAVTYKDAVDLSGVTKESYILEDRGSLNPDFGEIELAGVRVANQTVTLTVSDATAATANNALLYTGTSSDGPRERNAFGIYCTGAWYRDVAGTLYYGAGSDAQGYQANITKMGYQARASLELKLRHVGEEASAAACLANAATGAYDATGLWLPTIDRQFGADGFQSFEALNIQIPSTAATATDGTQDPFVRGYAYIPANYDPARGIVITLQGQGISYWKLPDGTDNDGTGIMYDSATTSWANTGAIVVNIHDRSSAGPGDYYESYDFVVDDANVIQYFLEEYAITGNIVLQGNSRGTMAGSVLIKALAGQDYSPKEQAMGYTGPHDKTIKGQYDFTIDTFICQNGSFGGNNIYVTADFAAVAKTGLRVWAFNGEQDTNDIENIATYAAQADIAAKGEAWIAEHVRLTAYPSELYSHWGESDHSTTRINGWYFDQAAFYGTDFELVNGAIVYNTKLADGDTYTLPARGAAANTSKAGHAYTVYDDLYQEWALELDSMTNAAAAQSLYEHFNWSHRDEYNDIWSPDMLHFADVDQSVAQWMAIECALQQGIVPKTENYQPHSDLTNERAIAMMANAFGVDVSVVAAELALIHPNYTNEASILSGAWATLLVAMDTKHGSPVQALPLANADTIAPRRYVKLWTPTDGATIYFKKTVSTTDYVIPTLDITEPARVAADTTISDKDKLDATKYTQIYTIDEDAHIKEDYPSNPDTYVTYQVVSVKDGVSSAARTYRWHLQRPTSEDLVYGNYQHTLIQPKTATQPAVYQICRDAETLRPMAWYVEGQTSGIVIDALQTNVSTPWDMKEYVDTHLATKPYVLVVGHAHPDHNAQTANFLDAGITTYISDRGWASMSRLLNTPEKQALVKDIKEGDSFDLGGSRFDVFALPGHEDSLVILADRASGLVFATDIYGCTRAGSADNVNVAGIRADLLLSLAQQTRADYEALGVAMKAIYTGHDEVPLERSVLLNFEAALQQVIDRGDAATTYTLRGGNNAMYSRTTIVGDMWKDGTNWLSMMLGGFKGDTTKYLSAANELYMNSTEQDTRINAPLDYNFVNGVQQYMQYSVLSNVEVTGGKLNGVDITWKAPATITWAGEQTTVHYTLKDKFNPWHYDYTISVPASSAAISIDATKMATNATISAIKVDGVDRSNLLNIPVTNASVITMLVTAPDQVTTSTYTFTVEQAAPPAGGGGGGGTGTPSQGNTVTNADGSTTKTETTTRTDATTGAKVETKTQTVTISGGRDGITGTIITKTDSNGDITVAATLAVTDGRSELQLPAALIQAVHQGERVTATLQLDGITLQLDATALAALIKVGTFVTITQVPDSKLPESLRAKATAYEFTVNGKGVDFAGSNIRITIPYTMKDAGKSPAVFFVAPDGTLTRVSGVTRSGNQLAFSTNHWSIYAIVEEEKLPFTDVAQSEWYYDAVRYVYEHKLFDGTTNTTFAPNATMTRAMAWTVLARLDGQDISGGNPWYDKAQQWAISTGVSDGTNPNDALTREQLVTILYGYAKSKGEGLVGEHMINMSQYTDLNQVSDWANEAFVWARIQGVVSGTSDTTLSPKSSATRAQVATILAAFAAKR